MNNNSEKSKLNNGISACMIVKNEENFLEQCLISIKDYVDEIIIVDTGSDDRTVDIAESFGARVYHHQWENHFSKHRNQSFGYAENDWILYIDADEELLTGSGELMRKAVMEAERNIDAIAVTLECIFNGGKSIAYNNAVRLFRNHRGFYYKGRVHNYIVGVKNVSCYPIRLFHHGYNLDKASMAHKFERTSNLLKLDIADDPDDPRPHHFLSASYLSEHMYEEALEEALLSISLSERKNEFSHNYLWSIYIASSASLNLGKIEKARKLAEKGIKFFPDHLDSYYILSIISYETHDSILFNKYFNDYLMIRNTYEKSPEKFGEMVHNTLGSQWILHLLKAFLLLDQNSEDEAIEAIKSAVDLCPDKFSLYLKLGNYYLNKNRLFEAETNFLKAGNIEPGNIIPKKLLATVYELMWKGAELKKTLEEMLEIESSDAESLFSLGLLHLERNEPEKALLYFEQISKENENIRVIINKAICYREIGAYPKVISLLDNLECEDSLLSKNIISNLAFSFLMSGKIPQSIETVKKIEILDKNNPYPPILLSRLYIEKSDIESCVHECSHLLNILGEKELRELNSIYDLARLYLLVAKLLTDSGNPRQYIQECLEISLILSGETPSIMADAGAIFINIGLLKTGKELLKKALLQAPSDKALRKQISSLLHP